MASRVVVFSCDASVFALANGNKEWQTRGKNGTLRLFHNPSNPKDIRIEWEKDGTKHTWRLPPRKLKSKGDRAWVLRAKNVGLNSSEVLALRFTSESNFRNFEQKFYSLIPLELQQQYLNGSDNNSSTWKCSICTYINPKDTQICQMCNMAQIRNTSQSITQQQQQHRQSVASEKWVCDTCTFINPSHAMKCGFCDALKERANIRYSITHVRDQGPNNNGAPRQGSRHKASDIISPPRGPAPQPNQQQQTMPPMQQLPQQPQLQIGGSNNINNVNNNGENMSYEGAQPVLGGNVGNYSNTSNNSNKVQMGSKKNSGDYNGQGGDTIEEYNEKWHCPVCTLINEAGTYQCHACGAQYLGSMSNALNSGGVAINNVAIDQRLGLMPQQSNQSYQSNILGDASLNNSFWQDAGISVFSGDSGSHLNGLSSKHHHQPASSVSALSSNSGNNLQTKSEQLQKVASDISLLNRDPGPIFHTLKTVTRKLLKNDIKYRTLDTTNPKVTERLLGFEGVLDFLTLLGFESDYLNYKLICAIKPSQQIIDKALEILSRYENQLSIGKMDLIPNKPVKGNNTLAVTNDGSVRDGSVSEYSFLSPGGGNGINGINNNNNNNLINGTAGSLNTAGNTLGDTDNGSNFLVENSVEAQQIAYNEAKRFAASMQQQQQQAQQAHIGQQQQQGGDELTLNQIILWSTHANSRDNDTMKTLVMTHKTFTDSLTLVRALRQRFWTEPVPQDIRNDENKVKEFQNDVQKRIQLKVIKALRDWMKYYWDTDFAGDTDDKIAIRNEVKGWIEFMIYNKDMMLGGSWNKPIAQRLLKEFERYCENGGKFKKKPIKDYNALFKATKGKGKGKGNDDSNNEMKEKEKENDKDKNKDETNEQNEQSKQSGQDGENNKNNNSDPDENVDKDKDEEEVEMIEDDGLMEYPEGFDGMAERSALEIAQQMTLMDFEIFSHIEARECLGQAWKKKNKYVKAPNILKLIDRFNHISTFIQYSILSCKGLKNRCKMLKKAIKIGEALRQLRNYNSLCAVWSALNSTKIHRLKDAWEKLPNKQKILFEQFGIIFLRQNNSSNMRHLFRHADPPTIPHLGLFLQDLVFIDDGNRDEFELNLAEDHALPNKMINFNKSVRVADRTKSISWFQQQGYKTKITKDDDILGKFLIDMFDECKTYTDDALWTLSEACKIADKKEADNGVF